MIDGRDPAALLGSRKNLVIIHLESVSWQQVHAFPAAFKNLHRLMARAAVFHSYYSSATSTKMAIGYLLHANDFEFDANPGLGPPAGNNRDLFTLLADQGYHTGFLNISAYAAKGRPVLREFAGRIPVPFASHDFSEVFAEFEKLARQPPFAVYVWNLMTHIEQSAALRSHATALHDLVGGAHAVADHALGTLLQILSRTGQLDKTCVVAVGDHGEDFLTHGVKLLFHGTEPYTPIIHTPLVISDPDLEVGPDFAIARTIDIVPTCLGLLGIPFEPAFPRSGVNLLLKRHRHAFSQNFTASQPDSLRMGVRKGFSVTDDAFTLMASSEGLELYNHRLDPTNHCNLLQFVTAEGDRPKFSPPALESSHMVAAFGPGTSAGDAIAERFRVLRNALAQHVASKRAFLVAKGCDPESALDPLVFNRISARGCSQAQKG